MQLKIALETIVVGILAAFALTLVALYVPLIDTHRFIEPIHKVTSVVEPIHKVTSELRKDQSLFAYPITIVGIALLFSFCYILGICINYISYIFERSNIVCKIRKEILSDYTKYNNDLRYIVDIFSTLFKETSKLDIEYISENEPKDITAFFGKIRIYIFQKDIKSYINTYDRLEEMRRLLRGSMLSFFCFSALCFIEIFRSKWLPTIPALTLCVFSLLLLFIIAQHLKRSIKLQNELLLRNFLVYCRSRNALN